MKKQKRQVMRVYYQYLTILLTLSIFLTVYFIDYSVNSGEDISVQLENFRNTRDDISTPQTGKSLLKTVVAYSFMKQIENEHAEISCPNLKIDGGLKSGLIAEDFPNGKWHNIRNTPVYVYSIYPDHRVKPFIYIRFIAMLKDNWKNPLYCQFHSTSSIKIIRASKTNIWSKSWKNPDRMMPVLYSCPITNGSKIDDFQSVSVSTDPCKIGDFKFKFPSNGDISRTIARDRLKITVCVKPLKFPSNDDIFGKLLSWLEMNSLFGIDRFDVYVDDISRKVAKLLKWYRDIRKTVNIVTYVNLSTNSDNVTNITAIWRKRKNELIAYNDCFYRNVHRTEFVVPLDIDEIIIPKIHDTYQELLNNLTSASKYSSLSVKNAFFFHKYNNYDIFSTVFRTKYSAPYRSGKSFIGTSNTLTVFNHYSLQPLQPGVSKTYFLNESLAQLNHYRQGCDLKLLPEDCKRILNSRPVFDDGILRFREKFFDRYFNVSEQLEIW